MVLLPPIVILVGGASPPLTRLRKVDLGRRLPDHATQLKKKAGAALGTNFNIAYRGEGGIEHDSSPPGMFSLMSSSTRIYSAYDLKPFFQTPLPKKLLVFLASFSNCVWICIGRPTNTGWTRRLLRGWPQTIQQRRRAKARM